MDTVRDASGLEIFGGGRVGVGGGWDAVAGGGEGFVHGDGDGGEFGAGHAGEVEEREGGVYEGYVEVWEGGLVGLVVSGIRGLDCVLSKGLIGKEGEYDG